MLGLEFVSVYVLAGLEDCVAGVKVEFDLSGDERDDLASSYRYA